MSRRAVLLAAACVAVPGTACGLTADFSSLQGGPSPTTDAAADATTDGSVDSAGDAGPVGDAPIDAPRTVEAGLGFCASLATSVKLCDDFDEGRPLDAGWGATDIYGGETASVDTSVSFSAPASFSSSVNPSDAPSSARLLQTVPTLSPHVHLEFEMLLPQPTDGTYELGVIHQVTANGTTYGLYLREVSQALQVELRTLEDDGGLYDQTWPVGPPSSTWSHVTIDLDVSDVGSFTVQVDGTVVTQSGVPTSTLNRTAMFVELGLYTYVPGTSQASFDDAIVDWQ